MKHLEVVRVDLDGYSAVEKLSELKRQQNHSELKIYLRGRLFNLLEEDYFSLFQEIVRAYMGRLTNSNEK